MGQIIEAKGRKPDPSRSSAIKNMPTPTNVSVLQAFLVLANYNGDFIPNMYILRAFLDKLLKSNSKWKWCTKCWSAFEEIKKILTSDSNLTYYDPKKDIIVASDASNLGFGAITLHKESNGQVKVIVHASRSLLSAERVQPNKKFKKRKKTGFRDNICSKKSSIDSFMEEVFSPNRPLTITVYF